LKKEIPSSSKPRGGVSVKRLITDRFHPRVVGVDYAWWFPEKGPESLFEWDAANVNVLTSDKPPFNPEMGSTNLRGGLCRLTKT